MAQMVKTPPAMQETWVQSLSWEDPQTSWRRKRQPTPVFLPGEFHGQRRLVGSSRRAEKSRIWLSDYHFHKIYFVSNSNCSFHLGFHLFIFLIGKYVWMHAHSYVSVHTHNIRTICTYIQHMDHLYFLSNSAETW